MNDDGSRRRLWQPPARIREVRSGERRVAFLELFFDLVFVVLVAVLAHHLAEHVTWSSVAWFVFLFLIVWSSWLNGSFYHDAHGTNDLSIRVFTFGQVLTLAIMGAYLVDVPGDGNVGFACAYAANSALLAVMWFRTGLHDPAHRAGAYPYTVAFALGAVLFLVSTITSTPTTYVLWALAVAVQYAAAVPAVRVLTREFGAVLASPSLIERFGLIVIIVLGEVVAGSVNGMASRRTEDLLAIVVGGMGVVLAIELWWLYFDLVSERMHLHHKGIMWMYVHVPLIIAIAAAGAGVFALLNEGTVVEPPARWLLDGSVAAALGCLILLAGMVEGSPQRRSTTRRVQLFLGLAALAMLALGLVPLAPVGALLATVLVLIAPVLASIGIWRLAD